MLHGLGTGGVNENEAEKQQQAINHRAAFSAFWSSVNTFGRGEKYDLPPHFKGTGLESNISLSTFNLNLTLATEDYDCGFTVLVNVCFNLYCLCWCLPVTNFAFSIMSVQFGSAADLGRRQTKWLLRTRWYPISLYELYHTLNLTTGVSPQTYNAMQKCKWLRWFVACFSKLSNDLAALIKTPQYSN